jgi:excisionase family DNA binding protein
MTSGGLKIMTEATMKQSGVQPFSQRYLSPKQAAGYLGLSVFSVYRLIERRAIPFVPLFPSGTAAHAGRPSVRFDIDALDTWMKKQTVKPAADYVDERSAK